MATKVNFKHPPITEALFDVKVILPKDTGLNILEKIHTEIQKEFPIKEVKAEWQTSFEIKPGETPTVLQNMGGPRGYMFYTEDRKEIFQARLDGFTFNYLREYKSWEDFSEKAFKLLKIYQTAVTPISMTRFAVRYINKIQVPLPVNKISDYINYVPNLADEDSHTRTNYFMRMQLENKENNNKALITNIVDLPKDSNIMPIIIDIDVFREETIDPKEVAKVEQIFLTLRKYKNTLFLNNITEATKKLFN